MESTNRSSYNLHVKTESFSTPQENLIAPPDKNGMRKAAKEIAKKMFDEGIFPTSPAGVMKADSKSIEANVNAKILHPTRGATTVQFLADSETKGNRKILAFCQGVQKSLAEYGSKINEEEYRSSSTISDKSIIPIENLHVTALAVGVVDAANEEAFVKQQDNSKAYRAIFKLFDQQTSLTEGREIKLENSFNKNGNEINELNKTDLLALIASHETPFEFINQNLPKTFAEQIQKFMDEEQGDQESQNLASVLDKGGVIFNATDLKITPNGSVVLQLYKNDALIQVKEALVELGGIAKSGLGNATAITIGYFPKFDKIKDNDLEQLKEKISILNNQLKESKLTAVMDHLTLVSFKVNSLRDEHIVKTPISSNMSLNQMKIEYLH